MLERIEPEVRNQLLDYSHHIFVTDGVGNLVWQSDNAGESSGSASALDMVVSAVRRMGQKRGAGELDSVLMSFDKLLVMVVRIRTGYLAVLADDDTKPGLLLIQARQLQAALDAGADHEQG